MIYNIRVGARLRGLEATIAGTLEKKGTNLFLKIPGTNGVPLQPLSQKVQKDKKNKKPQPATPEEAKSFAQLRRKISAKPVEITGPLKKDERGNLLLEVRQFRWGDLPVKKPDR